MQQDAHHAAGGPGADGRRPRRDDGREGRGGDRRAPAGGRPVRRRAIIAGGVAAALGGGAYLGRVELEQLWWRLPGNQRPRASGAVDHKGARWAPASTANYRLADRPYDYGIDRIVIHTVEGSFETALKVFADPLHRAAAHYTVAASDGRIAQSVRELDVAYHAGNREFNERSVGIEHEGFAARPESFTDAMYRSSARLAAGVCRRYDIPVDRTHIVAHYEVPGVTDRTDPGPHWDWDRYLRLIDAELRA